MWDQGYRGSGRKFLRHIFLTIWRSAWSWRKHDPSENNKWRLLYTSSLIDATFHKINWLLFLSKKQCQWFSKLARLNLVAFGDYDRRPCTGFRLDSTKHIQNSGFLCSEDVFEQIFTFFWKTLNPYVSVYMSFNIFVTVSQITDSETINHCFS